MAGDLDFVGSSRFQEEFIRLGTCWAPGVHHVLQLHSLGLASVGKLPSSLGI